jgi:hypothetical protein
VEARALHRLILLVAYSQQSLRHGCQNNVLQHLPPVATTVLVARSCGNRSSRLAAVADHPATLVSVAMVATARMVLVVAAAAAAQPAVRAEMAAMVSLSSLLGDLA